MQAVILAAGRGTRMGELTDEIPKPLLKIGGRPIVEYALDNLPEEISEIIFIVGYKGDMIRKYFGGEHKGRKISYCEQTDFNGTAGAICLAKDMLADRFLVLMGDDLYHKKDLKKLLRHDLALLVKKIENNTRFGVVEKDSEGNLKQVVEFKFLKDRKGGNLVNIGAYLMSKDFFDYPFVLVSDKEFGLPQTLAQMADKYKIKAVEADFWHPNGHKEDLAEGEKIINFFK
ncbi:MAG: nucleotidyltransferase family protein [Candidatus Portnoybacteria bacterium]|nr:nucleotidyltransferase family protein [Candidatus Portnoybacteria bacterium]MDD4982797.1 nucleotidyltransferase family protein [Candidatus Portnoybacteria bacterium]